MTVRLARLSGALLLQCGTQHWLIGDLKEPCDFEAAGFADPGPIRPLESPVVSLVESATRPAGESLKAPWAALAGGTASTTQNGEALARILARRLLITRNGSVSTRLWNLLLDESTPYGEAGCVDGRWLVDVPDAVWDMVRDSVLRC